MLWEICCVCLEGTRRGLVVTYAAGGPSQTEPQAEQSLDLPATSEPDGSNRLMLEITPQGAFAAGALIVATIGLAISVGHWFGSRDQQAPAQQTNPLAIETLDQLRQQRPLKYDDIPVDRGTIE